MKQLNLIILSLLFSLCGFAQKKNCKGLHEGIFRLSDNSIYTIQRTKFKQIEKDDKTGTEVEFNISWLDECTYILFDRKMIKGEDYAPPEFAKDTLYNEIISVNGTKHRVKSQIKRLHFITEVDITKLSSN